MSIKEKVEKWITHVNVDAKMREEILAMSEEQKQDAFYSRVEFGTAGMRGLLGPGSNRLNIFTIRRANVGFAKYLLSLDRTDKKGVAIAFDNRFMSKEFAEESAKVLASFGIDAYVYQELRSTPQLSYTVREKGCIGGIVITASHNPKEYNGYKVYDETGCQLVPKDIEKVIRYVNEIEDELSIEVNLTKEQESLIHWLDESMDQSYANAVLGIQLRSELKKDIKVVFSPQHGTAYPIVDKVLTEAGYQTVLVEEQCTPDPSFPNTKSPNPEDKIAYELGIEYAKNHHAEVVICTDPDADRVGVVVLHQGDYRLLTGNQTGSILIDYIFSTMKEKGLMPDNPVMFNTVVTSDLGESVARTYGVETEKTLTGFKFIGDKIAKYEKTLEKNFVFGYEESYGYLIQPFVRDKDAVQACLIIAEAVQYYKQLGKTLVDVLEELYDTYGTYLEEQESLTLKGIEGSKKITEILSNLRNQPVKQLAGVDVVEWEDYLKQVRIIGDVTSTIEGFPASDVLKMKLSDGSWVAVRPSGTEPKCKFYFCIKGNDAQDALSKYHEFSKNLKELTQ